MSPREPSHRTFNLQNNHTKIQWMGQKNLRYTVDTLKTNEEATGDVSEPPA